MPRVSIVIPAKNEAMVIGRLLASVRAQSFMDYELIVADAASTDQTASIALRYGARIVGGGRPGVGRNRGADESTGEWLLFLDADAVLPHKHFLRDVLKQAYRNRLDAASVRVMPIHGSVIDRLLHYAYNWYVRLLLPWFKHATGACLLSKRTLHRYMGGFDERIVFAEDCEYANRAATYGRFAILSVEPIRIDPRRIERDGRLAFAWKYLRAEWHLLFHGPIYDALFSYDDLA